MSNTPEEPGDSEPGNSEPVSLDDLAHLLGGELSDQEEARLRMRIARDPDAATKLAQLRNVDSRFPTPPPVELPTDMPPEVAARLQARLAAEAERRTQERAPEEPDSRSGS